MLSLKGIIQYTPFPSLHCHLKRHPYHLSPRLLQMMAQKTSQRKALLQVLYLDLMRALVLAHQLARYSVQQCPHILLVHRLSPEPHSQIRVEDHSDSFGSPPRHQVSFSCPKHSWSIQSKILEEQICPKLSNQALNIVHYYSFL